MAWGVIYPAHGILTGTAPNVTYTPDADYTGSDSFTFKVNDGFNYSNIATVAISITPVNDTPVVSDISDQTIDEGGSFATITLDNYVNDPDNADDELTWTYSGNTDLIISIDADRVVTITTPDSDWNGAETITFRATDPDFLWNEGAYTFTVNAINDPPSAPVVDVTPEASFTTDNLVCTIINPSTDIDTDNVTYTYEWYRNGELQSDLTTESVSASYTSKGELWKCVVTPNDGTEDGPGAFDEVNIQNSPPEASCKDIALQLDENGQATLKPEDVDDGSRDPDDDPIELSLDRTEFSCADLGDNTVTLTVTANDGLTDSCQATVTVVDVTPPDVSISSPEVGKTYINSQGEIAIGYTVEDVCDPDSDITVNLDGEIFTGDSISLCDLASGEHTLVVSATDDSGNKGETSVTFYVEPQALESFTINRMTVNWAPELDYPGGNWPMWMFSWWRQRYTIRQDDKFSISGGFQLPEGYNQEDLDTSATITISIADGSDEGHDTLIFNKRPLGRSGAMWTYWGYDNSPGERMNITRMTVWFSSTNSKHTAWAWFDISGVLELPDIGKNSEPANAAVAIELPIATEAGCGSLAGEETVTFKVSKKLNLWSYSLHSGLPGFWYGP